METSNNKRRHSRIDTRREVRYTVLNSIAEANDPQKSDKRGFVIDSSYNGIGFMTSDHLELGSHVQLNLSGTWRSGIVMWTAVMWKVDSESEYRVGVRFLDTEETLHEAAREPKDGSWTQA